MNRAIFLFAFLGALAATLAQDADKALPIVQSCACGPYQHYETNSHSRQLTCDNMHLGPIIGPGEPTTNACFCNGGYVRNNQGICIKRENCPIKTCPLNEHYEKDSNRCQISCANMHLEPIMGPCSTSSACFCNEGYVRNEKGICIKRGSCPPRCPPFERYLNQTAQCQITCKTMPLEPFMGPCWPTSGCFCLPGYVRNDAGICIRREECPPRCPPFERYLNQTAQCQITCKTMPLEPYMGPCWPTSGCFCLPGYVRNDAGICIRREECPFTCPLNEHYEKNTHRCQISCAILHLEPIMGPCGLNSACFCNDGYVRNDKGICIKRGNCPIKICPLNEHYEKDTHRCQIYCSTLHLEPVLGPCDLNSRCFCNDGYVRNDKEICIKRENCRPPCKKGEQYTECGSSCPATCESRGDTCTFCTQQCVAGCFCAAGTIRAPDGSCVKPKNCPPRTCSGQNEEFVECPPTCPPTENCSNIWSRFDCSNAIDCCKPSCRCKSGFYRNSQNVCISSQQCISSSSGAEAKAEARAESGAESGADSGAEAEAESEA